MDYKLELVPLPVTDVDRAKDFYMNRVGFNLDVDHHASDTFRVVQLTPPGSACSICFGIGITTSPPGSIQGLHLVVNDIVAAREELVGRGLEAGEIFHYGSGGREAGVDPEHRNYASYVPFSDPDGNSWLVQEVGYVKPGG